MNKSCPMCSSNSEPRRIHDTVYGFAGTHVAGSERFACAVCNYEYTIRQALDRGLKFVLDRHY